MEHVDRSKFRAAKLSANAGVVKDVEDASPRNSFDKERPSYHDIESGKNVFRIAPPHPEDDIDLPSVQAKCVAWIPSIVKDEKGKEIIKNRPVFNARIHGITTNGERFQSDPVEEYINFVRGMFTDRLKSDNPKMADKALRESVRSSMAPLLGYRDKNGKWVPGYRPQTSYVCYAWKNGKLGRLSLREKFVEQMNSLCTSDEDDSTGDDVFSDPDSGVSLIINYNEAEKEAANKYTLSKGSKPRPLSDEQLSELMDANSLKSMFYDVYDMSTFDKTVEGLRLLDEELEYDIFSHQEFLDAIEKIRDLVKESANDSTDETVAKEEPKATTKRASLDKPDTKDTKSTRQTKNQEDPKTSEYPDVDDESVMDKYSYMTELELVKYAAKNGIAADDYEDVKELRGIIRGAESDVAPSGVKEIDDFEKDKGRDTFLKDLHGDNPVTEKKATLTDIRQKFCKK